MQRKGIVEKWEIDELAEPLLIKKRKIKAISVDYFNEAIRKAIKIGRKAGIEYQKGMEELERRVIKQRKKSE